MNSAYILEEFIGKVKKLLKKEGQSNALQHDMLEKQIDDLEDKVDYIIQLLESKNG